MHESLPSLSLNFPFSQAVHSEAATPEKNPGGHAEQVVLSVEEKVPALHGEQKPSPGFSLTNPCAQGRQPAMEVAPVDENLPCEQGRQ